MKTAYEVAITDSLPSFSQGALYLEETPDSDTGSDAGYAGGKRNSASIAG